MKDTLEQIQIMEYIKGTENGHVGISAYAGCGKTTTILGVLRVLKLSKKVKFFAFSNLIASELKDKVHSGVNVSTVHSAGFGVLKENCDKVTIKESKVVGYVAKYAHKTIKEKKNAFIYSVTDLLLKHKMTLKEYSDVELAKTVERYSINLSPHLFKDVRAVQKTIDDYNKRNIGGNISIDFSDMVTLPLLYNLEFKKFDVVFFDEAQDMGECHKRILLNSLKENGRFVVVFDKRQNIFGFASADVRVLEALLEEKSAKIFPLSFSFRCSKEVVKHCGGVYDGFQAFPTNQEGTVRNGSVKDIGLDGDAVLCRNTKPLFDVYVDLISRDIACYVKGREFGEELTKMLKKYKGGSIFDTANNLDNVLYEVEQNLIGYGVSKPKRNKKYIEEYEKVVILKKLLQLSGTVAETSRKVLKIFTNSSKGIPLMTIHKSKGLEFNRVFIMRDDLLPSRYAESKDDMIQERNLDWVKRSRAKKDLIYITDFIGDAKIEQVDVKKLSKDSTKW